MKNVICMKWGTLYGPEYVNRLYAMVRRHCHGDLRFVCLTDEAFGIRKEVETHDCPTVAIPEPFSRLGWRKLSLFSDLAHLYRMEGKWLYLDLDVVILDDLEPFFSHRPEEEFIVMRNGSQPKKRIGNTSVYRFEVGTNRHLLVDLLAKHDVLLKRYRNSQTYISEHVDNLLFWPNSWCALFKVDCVPPWPSRFWKPPHPPDSAKVVAFPGNPNPHEAMKGEWPVKKPYKKLYKFIRPATWISEAWCE
jgi:hypothetical protein